MAKGLIGSLISSSSSGLHVISLDYPTLGLNDWWLGSWLALDTGNGGGQRGGSIPLTQMERATADEWPDCGLWRYSVP